MDGVVENKNMKQYNIFLTHHIEQFHDEVIDKIEVTDNKLVLYIDELHFDYGNKFTKCRIIFSQFEDIFSDISFIFMNIHKNKIKSGKKLYLDEFFNYTKKQKISIEIRDIYEGYEKILIVGKITNGKMKYGNFIQLHIDTKSITYEFY